MLEIQQVVQDILGWDDRQAVVESILRWIMAQGGVAGTDMSLLQGKTPGGIGPAPSLSCARFYTSMSPHSWLPDDVFQIFLQDSHFQMMVVVVYTHSDESEDHLQRDYYLFAARNRGDKHDVKFVNATWQQLFRQGVSTFALQPFLTSLY